MEDEVEEKRVEIAHEDHAKDNGDDTKKFHLIITLYAMRKIVCDCAMKFYDENAGDNHGDAAKEPAPTK